MNKVFIVGVGVCLSGAALWYFKNQPGMNPQDENFIDAGLTVIDELAGGTGELEYMQTSNRMLDMLMRRESFAAVPYQLDDGWGMTWGFGHKQQRGESVPDRISRTDAAVLFADDVIRRAERWVKLYVAVPLSQNEFDALVSIAFNMSPQSFKKFANEVNNGNGINAIANESIAWVKPIYTNGIRNRRNDEMNVFNNGVYA